MKSQRQKVIRKPINNTVSSDEQKPALQEGSYGTLSVLGKALINPKNR